MTIFGTIDVLSFLVFAPAIGALIVLLLPQEQMDRALGGAGDCDGDRRGERGGLLRLQPRRAGLTSSSIQTEWFQLLGSSWHIGIDGISATMVLLTGILTPLAVLVSFEIDDRINAHMALILFFETGLFGVFVAMDLMVFFLFYELTLVPMYFIIDQWGGPNRKYASTKFFIYSMGGSLGMLLATQLIGFTAGTFDIQTLTQSLARASRGANGSFLGVPIETVKALAFLGFFVAFCIKVPVWPFHTWLPDAHSEAPTAGSMLLAGVMLKLGAYGFLRLVIPLFPDVWISQFNIFGITGTVAGLFAFLAMLGIVLGAFAAWGQTDIKRLVAYSSVNHMGFVALGLAVAALAYAQATVGGGTRRYADGDPRHQRRGLADVQSRLKFRRRCSCSPGRSTTRRTPAT